MKIFLFIFLLPSILLAFSSCNYDESRNELGPNKCQKHTECQGLRTCSNFGWCQGDSGCEGYEGVVIKAVQK